jgi:hypothetical protein
MLAAAKFPVSGMATTREAAEVAEKITALPREVVAVFAVEIW